MISHNKPVLDIEEEQAALKVIRSGWLAHGSEVEGFENEFCEYLGLPQGHAAAVTNGTSALFLALWALHAQGKRVAFPVYSCSSLRHAVAMIGASEVLSDVSDNSPNMDLHSINPTAIDIAMIPHMFGLPQDVSAIKEKKIGIIEDCAQALGASVNNIPVGLQGDLGIFSFYATKLMTSGGHGGIIVSKNKSLIDKLLDYKNFDQRRDRKERFNFHMTDIQAAIGRVQLKKLPAFIKRRDEIFAMYRDAGLNLLDVDSDTMRPVRYRAVLMTDRPAEIISALADEGIKAIIPIEDWELLGDKDLYPNSLNLSTHTVSLPIYPSLSDTDVKKIISIAGRFI